MRIFFDLIQTIFISFFGGYVFHLLSLPLPWVLGSLTAVVLWQGFTKRKLYLPNSLKNGSLILLGAYFGLYFTLETFITIWPFLLPYLFLIALLILISIWLSIMVTKWISVDKVTSTFSSIPGGLTEMVVASESLHANSSYVTIFQTIRLLTVLFTVPPLMIALFSTDTETLIKDTYQATLTFEWSYSFYIFPIIVALILKDKVPAGIVVGPMLVVALLNIILGSIPPLPELLLIIAQICLGASLGINIHFSTLKEGGKYGFVYLTITLVLIIVSIGLGWILSKITSLDLATALLSTAPGGLIEMVLIASQVGADPAMVSALQLTRILLIVTVVPIFLKWFFSKRLLDE
ncbi:putative ammonia monooxygenase [Bacillus sp. TS-2]|nr:putative ammonia monooxygenase [Bacillus sp. TS-2]